MVFYCFQKSMTPSEVKLKTSSLKKTFHPFFQKLSLLTPTAIKCLPGTIKHSYLDKTTVILNLFQNPMTNKFIFF